jgi:metal-responsive CopG/Arc/MetJ family transcriptional regulator
MISNVKTSAISIDEEMLACMDRLVGQGGRGATNRSRLIRQAVREHLVRLERMREDTREATLVRRHRGRLARQARTLVRAQTNP